MTVVLLDTYLRQLLATYLTSLTYSLFLLESYLVLQVLFFFPIFIEIQIVKFVSLGM